MRNIDSQTEEYALGATTAPETAPRRRNTTKNTSRQAKPTPDPTGPRHKKPKARPRENTYTFIDFLKDYRTHLGFGIVLCFIGIVMTVSTISFLFSNAADQSVTLGRSLSEIVNAGDTVENAGGPFGAKLAEILMIKSFGLGSFIIAVYIFVIGLAVMRACKISFFTFTFRCLFSTAAVSIIAGLLTYNSGQLFNLGGNHGYYINQWLMAYSGALGAYGVTLLLLGLMIAVFLNPIKKFISLIGKISFRSKQPAAETDGAEETAGADTPLDTLDTPEENDEEEIVSETSADTDEEVQETVDTTDYSRFMPPAALDAFDSHDDDVADSVRVAAHAAEAQEIAASAPVGTTDTSANVPGEPELIIVTKTPEESDEAGEPRTIQHGDHITLDQPYDARASHSLYKFPPVDLLIQRDETVEINEAEQFANKKLIVDALRSYNIDIQRIEATIGPTVTLYEIVPAQGTRIAKIKSLEDDIAMRLSALGIRIIAPIPGKGTVGIEVPNRKPRIVSMRSVIESKAFANTKCKLPMALGATISNDYYIADLAELPHLLVAGATGQGKSVGLNCIITSLLYSKHPDELKFVLVDPKTVEFSLFETISKQFLAKLPDETKAVITDPKKVVDTLNSLCVEMDNRYALLSDARVRNISEYNERFKQRRLNPENGHRYLPYIVVIVDEYADLVMVAGKDVAHPICRIAQKARAVGMHMIIATQRPSTDIITGMIKANFTARIAFKVTQGVDSKTILDRSGAQRLIGKGDMLTMLKGSVDRVQCAFVDTPEIEAICDFIGNQDGFVSCYELPEPPAEDGADGEKGEVGPVTDEFKRCALFISSQTQASITMMQRKFEIGFNKAGRFMDQMQQMGIVGPAKGAKPRDVLMTPDEVARLFE